MVNGLGLPDFLRMITSRRGQRLHRCSFPTQKSLLKNSPGSEVNRTPSMSSSRIRQTAQVPRRTRSAASG